MLKLKRSYLAYRNKQVKKSLVDYLENNDPLLEAAVKYLEKAVII